MKMLSFNARGLGEGAKRRVIREMVANNHVEVLCIQESKLQYLDKRICSQIWGDSNFEWRVIPAVNRSGGLICIWNPSVFSLVDCVTGTGFLGLIGTWVSIQQQCVIVNVYSPCDMVGKRALWGELIRWRHGCQIASWCLAGDFNAVRSPDERRGAAGALNSHRLETHEFNSFIADMELLDVPLAGRKFTWRRPNNRAQSRIDRFLVSHEWSSLWPDCSQLVLQRDVSDHCPILLRQKFQNWGARPFRVLNCWLDDPRLVPFVERSWAEVQVSGWGAYSLKEKLKGLRGKLKAWNLEVFGELKSKSDDVVKQINLLDVKEDAVGLLPAEVDARNLL
ncbi:uncharacterized protein LOC130743648 [Lotus japonicus]|uniref:uncharacterized protein LOC130743648 n=1 Tax=Lotus japonicus TaxID=34305 RepID=UPI00258CA38A|nr:uncharacterized protein LOC130743648 [Lotus japonicus]